MKLPGQYNGEEQCFEEEDKTENGGTQFGHKHHLEFVFLSSLHQLIILHSNYHRFMLAQLIPWGRVCTVGKHEERVNSLMSTVPARHTPTQIKCSTLRVLTPTLPSRALRPLSSPFLCLEVELLLVLWFPSFPLPVPLDKDVDDWLTVLFRLGCSTFGGRWSPDREGEETGSSFFSSDLFDLAEQIYFKLLGVFPSLNIDLFF